MRKAFRKNFVFLHQAQRNLATTLKAEARLALVLLDWSTFFASDKESQFFRKALHIYYFYGVINELFAFKSDTENRCWILLIQSKIQGVSLQITTEFSLTTLTIMKILSHFQEKKFAFCETWRHQEKRWKRAPFFTEIRVP